MTDTRVVVIGHVDHGKSTLIGRLLYDSSRIPDERVAEIDAMVDALKGRFEFAYFLDSLEEEVAEARTIDTVSVRFQGARPYVISDVPGHDCFVKNMLTGAAGADVAVLVVSAVEGVEAQTRRHLRLARLVGIPRLVAAVNKMDLAGWDEHAFRARADEVLALASREGYDRVEVVPICAATGDHVVWTTRAAPWHDGPPLLAVMDAADTVRPARPDARLLVQGAFEAGCDRVWLGRVAEGTVAAGDVLRFEPSGASGRVVLRGWGTDPAGASRGDAVAFSCDAALARGDVGGPVDRPPVATRSARVEVLLLEGALAEGDALTLHAGTAAVPCRVEAVEEAIDSETGERLPAGPAGVRALEAAVLRLSLPPVVVEPADEGSVLGRVVLARGGRGVAAGVVMR